MKIIDVYFNKKIKDTISSMETSIIKYTGNMRRIKTIFGKVKEQKEFYIIEKRCSIWNNSCSLIENGPHWK